MEAVQKYQAYLAEAAKKDEAACAESTIELTMKEIVDLFDAAHRVKKGTKKNPVLLTIESDAGHKLHIKLADKK